VSFGGSAPATAEAVRTLDRAVAQTIGAVDEPVRSGQYRYIATRAWWMATRSANGQDFARLEETLLEKWAQADQDGRLVAVNRTGTGNQQWVVGTEEEAKAAGLDLVDGWSRGEWRGKCVTTSDRSPCPSGWQSAAPEWQAGLPTDPDTLFERLAADAPDNGRGDAELLAYAADALRTGLVRKDVRANIYQALTRIPGLQVVERQANLGGRVGIALGVDDGNRRQDIIIDPETGQFIGERQVVTGEVGGFPAGTVLESTSVTTSVVDRVGDKTAG
jgi:hypothetical protein